MTYVTYEEISTTNFSYRGSVFIEPDNTGDTETLSYTYRGMPYVGVKLATPAPSTNVSWWAWNSYKGDV